MNVKPFSVLLLALCVALMAGASSAAADTVRVVGFGDSLMAGYRLDAEDAFPNQLEAALQEKGYDVEITNAGVSGDTTAAGLARLDWSVPDGADAVILELGANDALRGISPERTEENLDEMITRLKERGIEVVLAGMIAPPNMGDDYAEKFNPIYERLASKHDVRLYPFFLHGVAANAALHLEDGMHPNAQGVAVMVERFLPVAEDLVTDLQNGTN